MGSNVLYLVNSMAVGLLLLVSLVCSVSQLLVVSFDLNVGIFIGIVVVNIVVVSYFVYLILDIFLGFILIYIV